MLFAAADVSVTNRLCPINRVSRKGLQQIEAIADIRDIAVYALAENNVIWSTQLAIPRHGRRPSPSLTAVEVFAARTARVTENELGVRSQLNYVLMDSQDFESSVRRYQDARIVHKTKRRYPGAAFWGHSGSA